MTSPASASALRLALAVLLFTACGREDRTRTETSNGSLAITVGPRVDVRFVGGDTLSDSARVVRLIPEPDGDGVGIVFADPSRRVSAGLALADRAHPAAQLLWPDSITAAWWSSPHTISFSTMTGTGIRAVVDVHKATLEIVAHSTDTLPPAASAAVPAQNSGAMLRATAYIDSLYVQPAGQPQRSTLKYSVDHLSPSASGQYAAIYVTARDSSGKSMNPAWYAMAVASGRVERVEQITGSTLELPAEAAGWSGDGHFFFAKGRSVWEAKIAPQVR